MRLCVCSDSEMEIEAEHYTNGVVEGSSARIMNGTYKHEEILQPDDNSIGNGVAGTNPPAAHRPGVVRGHLSEHALSVRVCVCVARWRRLR